VSETLIGNRLTGDVTSVLGRPLAAEINKPPLSTNENSYIPCERCAKGRKFVLNTDRKPWSLYRLVTPLPVSDVNELVKWREGRCKLANNLEIAGGGEKVSTYHK
jgi:hypothetical protein